VPSEFYLKASSIDWALLRLQKEWLLSIKGSAYADGLIHLLDGLQGAADKQGVPNVFSESEDITNCGTYHNSQEK